jgi:hypothetical protein
MLVASLRWKLTPEHVRETPDVQGVFSLWDADECVYVAHTRGNRTLRDCLREHLLLRERGVIQATHFAWEITATPRSREADLLAAMRPRYNQQNSPLRPEEATVTDLRARTPVP